MSSPETSETPVAQQSFFYGYIIVIASLCIIVASWGSYFAFGVFFEPVLTEFGWTRAENYFQCDT